MSKFTAGEKVKIKLDSYDEIFRPSLKSGMVGEIVEQDTFSVDNPDTDVMYVVKVGDTTHAFFEDQLEKADN